MPGNDVYQRETAKGDANGYAGLNGSGVVPAAQLPTLDVIPAPVATVNFAGQQAGSMRLENLTADPGSPTVGQVWLRIDL